MSKGTQNSFPLQANTVCQNFVYFQTSSNQILLLTPGSWIDQKFFKKCKELQDKIILKSVIDEEVKEKFKSLLSQHCLLEFDQECFESKDIILSRFNNLFSIGGSILNWSIACFEVFNKLDASEINELHETDVNLFRKALLSSSLALWISLTNGFYEPSFLGDLYHIAFLQDSGLIHPDYSYHITEALDRESMIPGQGFKYLVGNNASEAEIKLFKDHPFGSYEVIKRLDILHNPDMANSVLLGHELSGGEGFPFGYTEAVLASWEKFIILADHLVEYQGTVEFDLNQQMNKLKTKKLESLPVKKVFARTYSSMTYPSQEVSA